MARLVSLPVSYATDAVLAGEIAAGVSTAPSDTGLIERWFAALTNAGDTIEHRVLSQ
jgi:saccharopine dehydrogenase (NADP+, L-glutamate forming)